jgi:NAD(P)-dependent dehydrogenase (short-subunit alcohol dehydrogenase family)
MSDPVDSPLPTLFDLRGRTALVTGAGRNAGAGIARCLADRGASVAVNDLVESRAEETAQQIRETGGRAVAAAFDVTQPDAVAAGVALAEAALGPIDILVNNAGVPDEMIPVQFREMEPAEWRRYIDLNLYGVLHCTKATFDGMCARGWGRVITISSGAAQTGLAMGVSLYGAGKAGALGFTRHLAQEVAPHGVRVNAIALGLMSNVGNSDLVAALAKTIPTGRLGSPADVGAAVVFLASDEADWITGQVLGVNGGSV